ncbi:rRNA adenine methyltransferase [Paludifilum halophilum]|uniref:rRNA adenine N-6-methyltransferase n=2 Tax=Paludifilum halophilum TaxID=1642702 RepID=A0A235B8M0_9BACL|nr:rRNA adenine methyltransferase [Paludifilum halophilum]
MHNKRMIHDLIRMAELHSDDLVVEIGAGTGLLTIPMAEKAGKVLAVEKDPFLIQKMQKKIRKGCNIRVIQQDFLRINLPKRPFCVVANIPYSITTPILKKLLDRPSTPVQKAVLVMEKGAAKRFTANPVRNPHILKWRIWFDIQMGRTIPPHCFSPPPRIDSAVLLVRKKEQPGIPPCHHARLMALAATGLKNPGLPLSRVFKGIFTSSQITRLARDLDIDRDMPVQFLNEQQWEHLFRIMMKYVPPFRWPKVKNRMHGN